ncbi:MAG: hypothetical protein WA374_05230, partial [Acidobacteriaceae bacterium]
ALRALDGEIGTVSFDPGNQERIRAAIASMEATIDRKVASYRGNPLVENILPQMKEKYRAAILDRVNSARKTKEPNEE